MILRLALFLLSDSAALFAETPTQRIGQPLEIREVHIPGGEVRVKPRRDRQPPLMVRMLEAKPAKDGFRYDFEVQGLEAGRHDLADFLEAPAGTTLPEIPLEITGALPPGIVHPHRKDAGDLPELGGYRNRMSALAVLWCAGLIGILVWRKWKPSRNVAASPTPPSLAERLRPLVAAAATGDLSADDRAKLERLVIGHWRERLPDIAALSPAEAMWRLRNTGDASPLILALERWLHSPTGDTSTTDVERLLAPYSGSTPASPR